MPRNKSRMPQLFLNKYSMETDCCGALNCVVIPVFMKGEIVPLLSTEIHHEDSDYVVEIAIIH